MTSSACALLLAAVSAASADEPPVARAGISFLAYPGEHIILDGSQSYDPEGWDITFLWTQVGGPPVQILDATGPHPEFDAVDPGVHSFQLVVDDGFQSSDPDVVDVIVVDPDFGSESGGGCSSTASSPRVALAWLALLPALVLRRRS